MALLFSSHSEVKIDTVDVSWLDIHASKLRALPNRQAMLCPTKTNQPVPRQSPGALEFGCNRFQFVLAPGQNAFHQRLNGAGQRPITSDTALHLGIYLGRGSGTAMVIGLVVQPG